MSPWIVLLGVALYAAIACVVYGAHKHLVKHEGDHRNAAHPTCKHWTCGEYSGYSCDCEGLRVGFSVFWPFRLLYVALKPFALSWWSWLTAAGEALVGLGEKIGGKGDDD